MNRRASDSSSRRSVVVVWGIAGLVGCQDAFLHDLLVPDRPSPCADEPPVLAARPRDDGTVRLEWILGAQSAGPDAIVQRSDDGSRFVNLGETREASYVDQDPELRDREVVYRIRVEGCPNSNEVRVRTAPRAPANLQADVRPEGVAYGVELTWEPDNRLPEVCFEVSGPSGVEVVAGPVFSDGPFAPESELLYEVRAVHPCEGPGLRSPPATRALVVPPSPVEDFALTAPSFGSISGTWADQNQGVAGYRVERRREGEAGVERSFDVDTPAFLDSEAIVSDQVYTYAVRALGADGGASVERTATIRALARPRLELEVSIDADCRLEGRGSVELDPRASEVAATATFVAPVLGPPLEPIATATGAVVELGDGRLDLDRLLRGEQVSLTWTVRDDLGAEAEAIAVSFLAVSSARSLTPVFDPGPPVGPGRRAGRSASSLPGQQPIVRGVEGLCLQCQGRPASISAGFNHVCAVLDGPSRDRALVCWGSDADGELGSGGIGATRDNPVFVCDPASTDAVPDCPAVDEVDQVSAGASFTCAVRRGQALCTGSNFFGQLGIGGRGIDFSGPERSSRLQPVCRTGRVDDGTCVPLSGVSHVRATRRRFACAFMNDGRTLCWGNVFPDRPTRPCAVGPVGDPSCARPLEHIATFGAGGGAYCFVLADGEILCGGNNGRGELGRGVVDAGELALAPVCVSGSGSACVPMEDVVALDGGNDSMCALREGGEVWCWGDHTAGQLGSGIAPALEPLSPTPRPVCRAPVPGTIDCPVSDRLRGAVALASGQSFACALIGDGTVECWGGETDQTGGVNPLGDGNPMRAPGFNRPYAAPVCEDGRIGPGGACVPLGRGSRGPMVALTAGSSPVCAVSERGQILCWGAFALGHGPSITRALNPVPVCETGDGDGDCLIQAVSSAALKQCRPVQWPP